MAVDDVAVYNTYLDKLGAVAEVDICTLADLETALRRRHDFFASLGCRLSDHGLEQIYAASYTPDEVAASFARIRGGQELTAAENTQLKSALLVLLAEMDWEKAGRSNTTSVRCATTTAASCASWGRIRAGTASAISRRAAPCPRSSTGSTARTSSPKRLSTT